MRWKWEERDSYWVEWEGVDKRKHVRASLPWDDLNRLQFASNLQSEIIRTKIKNLFKPDISTIFLIFINNHWNSSGK